MAKGSETDPKPESVQILEEVMRRYEELSRENEDMREQLVEVRADLRIANAMGLRMEQAATGAQMREQEIAAKWRGKVQALNTELLMAQKGLTSGCGCPIGNCQKRSADVGSCWLQWAEGHLLRRMGQQRIDDVMRAGNHPRRYNRITDVHDSQSPQAEGQPSQRALPGPSSEGDQSDAGGTGSPAAPDRGG